MVEPLESRDLLAAVPVGLEFRVNTVTTSFQNDPSVAFDANGNYVVAWTSYLQDGSSNGIYAQRYSSTGAALGTEFRVNTFTTGLQAGAAVARSAAGDFVVTWASLGQDGSGLSVHAQRFDAAGVAQGTEFQVNTFTTGNQFAPAIALNADGDFVIAWESFGQDGAGYGVYAQRYNANGTVAGAEFRANTFTTGNQRTATVGLDGEGNFVIAWASNGQDASGYGVYAQRFTGAGGAAGAEFRVNAVTSGDQATPTVGMAPGGEFVIAWASNGQDGSGIGVYAQRYAAGGAAQGPEFRVNSFTTGSQRSPTVALDDTGDFVIAWESFAQDGSGYGIFAQKFNSAGVAQEAEFRVNSFTTGVQRDAAVGMDGAGNFLVAWNSDAQDGSLLGVYAQQYALPPRVVDVINPALDQSLLGTQPALGTTVSQLAVSFDQIMATSGTGSVTQLGHWGLARGATDLSALITGITAGTNAVTGRFEAKLALSSALTPGDYQLTVRATLASTFGLALDGNGDTVAGGDYLASFTVAPIGPAGPEFRVNTFTTGIQRDAAVATDPAGNFVIAWSSIFQDGSLGGIYAQRYSALGVPLGGEFRVNTFTTNEQTAPAVAMDAAGNFIVAWASFPPDGSSFGVYAQRYSALGVPLGGEFRVNTFTADSQFAPAVAMDQAGNFVVAWASTGQDGSGVGVYAQRYDAAGVPVGSEFRVNTFTSDAQRDPAIAMDPAGNFVIAWNSIGQDGSGVGVYAQRYSAAGTPVGSEFRVNSFTTDAQRDPTVAMDGAGNFVIAWSSYLQDRESYGIYAQRYDAAGAAVGSEFRVNSLTTSNQSDATSAMDAAGNFIVAWSSFNLANNTNEIRAQRYSAAGTTLGAEFRVKGSTADSIVEPTVALDGHGNFVVAWTSSGEDGSLYGVYAQRFAQPVPVASVNAQATAVRGESVAFVLSATTAGVPLGNYSFQIDWENDGLIDQTVVGPSGTAVNHVFATAGARTVRVVATDAVGQASAPVFHALAVNAFELRGADLYWGGTNGVDAFFFVPGLVLTQALDNQFFTTLQVTPVGAFAGKLVVYGQGGSDLVFCDVLTNPIELYGGDGDDVLIGGRGSDRIEGGDGADILFGGTLSTDGDDTLLGGVGDDLLVGHLGADRLEGGTGKDLLMAGALSFGPDLPSAVFSIQAEWTSSRPLADKVANLTGTGSGPRNNGNFFLVAGTTALDDTSVDTMFSGADEDWYLRDLAQDLVPDIAAEDATTAI